MVQNSDILATAIAVTNSFMSDPGVSCLLPAFIELQCAYLSVSSRAKSEASTVPESHFHSAHNRNEMMVPP